MAVLSEPAPVSRPRSSNRTCWFQASRFPTGVTVRPTRHQRLWTWTVCLRVLSGTLASLSRGATMGLFVQKGIIGFLLLPSAMLVQQLLMLATGLAVAAPEKCQ